MFLLLMPPAFSSFGVGGPFCMLDDLQVIVKTFPDEMDVLRVYALGDVHVGSPQYNERAIRKKIEIIQNDPNGVVCICGDLGDFGLKNSKTNIYEATMTIREQLEYIYELFLPITDKIVSVVPGNHEERLTKEVGTCPLYDLCVRWGIQDVYRQNAAILKLGFGSYYKGSRPVVFFGVTSHGSSRNKHQRFISCFDGIDFFISGHTHTPSYTPHGKIRIDAINEVATHVPHKEIVVDANLATGGYSMKYEYEIPAPPEVQYLELTAYRENRTRKRRKVMSYHTIQI